MEAAASEKVRINVGRLEELVLGTAGIERLTIHSNLEYTPVKSKSPFAECLHYMSSRGAGLTSGDVASGYFTGAGIDGANHLAVGVNAAYTAEAVLKDRAKLAKQDRTPKSTAFDDYIGMVNFGVTEAIYKAIKPRLPEMPLGHKLAPYIVVTLSVLAGSAIQEGANVQAYNGAAIGTNVLVWGSLGLIHARHFAPRGQFHELLTEYPLIRNN